MLLFGLYHLQTANVPAPVSVAGEISVPPEPLLPRFSPSPPAAPTVVQPPEALLVSFRSSTDAAQIEQSLQPFGGQVVRVFENLGVMEVIAAPGFDLQVANDHLLALDIVDHSELNTSYNLHRLPNDPRLSELWGLHIPDSPFASDADIEAAEAWDRSVSATGVQVMVIDTGISADHPDLAGNIWTNPLEIPDNGIDDDGNGYIDDVNGADALSTDSNDPVDSNRHGSHVSGTIGAVGDNGIGVSGVFWRGEIIACRAFDNRGVGVLANLLFCMDYAIALKRSGVNLVATNNSYGGTEFSQLMKSAIERLNAAGILVVASAGNANEDTDVTAHYPSSYEVDNIVSVAATNRSGDLAHFSNYGVQSVDIAAPGQDILSTGRNRNYLYLSGTSMAAPHVTGYAALIAAANPTLGVREIRDRILASVTLDERLTGRVFSGGRLSMNLPVIDRDGDQMSDAWETRFGLNPADAADSQLDLDGDGLSNLREFQLRTDPTAADTDSDGLDDAREVNETGTNPLLTDTDGDGLTDLEETGPGTSDAKNADTDSDGLNDAQELAAGTSPFTNDTDGDGLLDRWETVNGTDPLNPGDALQDPDGDGLSNRQEQQLGTHPQFADSDGDGLDDRREVQDLQTDPLNQDTDRDDLPDGFEIDNGLDPLDAADADRDFDGDGFSNRTEYLAGSDVRDATRRPRDVQWTMVPGSAGRAGFVPQETADSEFRSRWQVLGTSRYSGVAMDDDALYLAGSGGLEARRRIDGVLRWRRGSDLDGHISLPVVAAGRLIVREEDWRSGSRRLVALDPLDGSELWATSEDDELRPDSLVASNGQLLLQRANGIIAIDVTDGTQRWEATVPGADSAQVRGKLNPAVNDEHIVVAYDALMSIHRRTDGQLLGQVDLPACERASRTRVMITDDDRALVSNGRCLAMIDIASATARWTVEQARLNAIAPTLAGSVLYSLERDGRLYLVERDASTGARLRSTALPGFAQPLSQAQLVSTLDHVFVPTEGGVVGVERDSMTVDWVHPVGGAVAIGARGTLVIGGQGAVAVADVGKELDRDQDGMPDFWELGFDLNFSSPGDAILDPDGDGLSNLAEYRLGTRPDESDSDDDGLTDQFEHETSNTDPLRADSDGDGLADGDEVTVQRSNPLRVDTDGDGVSDGTEIQEHGTSPISAGDVRSGLISSYAESFENGLPEGWQSGLFGASDWSVSRRDANHGWYSLSTSPSQRPGVARVDWRAEFAAGTLTFDARLAPSDCCGGISVWLDDKVLLNVGGSGWNQYRLRIPAGDHTISFQYNRTRAIGPQLKYAAIDHLQFSPTRPPASGQGQVYAYHANQLVVLNADANQALPATAIAPQVRADNIAPTDDRRLAFLSQGDLHFLDLANGTQRSLAVIGAGGAALAISSEYIYVSSSTYHGITRLTRRGDFVDLTLTDAYPADLAIGEDGKLYALLGDEGLIAEYDAATMTLLRQLDLVCPGCRALNVEVGGELTLLNRNGRLLRFDASGQRLAIDELPGEVLYDLARVGEQRLAFSDSRAQVGFVAAQGLVGEIVKPFGARRNGATFVAHFASSGTDVDADGLPDWWEGYYGLNRSPSQRAGQDLDNDGLTNFQEFLAGSAPNLRDTDRDGLDDGDEVSRYGTDPAQADSDNDGLDDGREVAIGAQPLNADTDGDGISDGDEDAKQLSATDSDSDGDGMDDGWELSFGLDPSSAQDAIGDQDDDGLTALQEFLAGTDPTQVDSDGDGVADDQEQRDGVSSPSSRDSDLDGMDDGWELRNGLDPNVHDSELDADGDGYSNALEFFANSDPQSRALIPAVSPWSGHHGGPTNRGYFPRRADAPDVELLFDLPRPTGSVRVRESAVADRARLYVLQGDGAGSRLIARDAYSGELAWERRLDESSFVGGLALAGDLLYVQTDRPARLLAIAAEDGTDRWSTELEDGHAQALSPTVLGRDLFLLAGTNAKLLKIDARTGAKRWEHKIERADRISVAADPQRVYLYGRALGANVEVIDRESGLRRFGASADGQEFSAPLPGSAAVLDRDGVLYSTTRRRVFAYDTFRRVFAWQRLLSVRPQLSWANGQLYAIEEGDLVALDPRTGAIDWRWEAPLPIVSSVLVTIDHAFVATQAALYMIDLATREPVRQWAGGGQLSMGPGGVLYTITGRGRVRAFQVRRDSDADRMSDAWELANGLDKDRASDALEDIDGDGLDNRTEFELGLSPTLADTDGDGLSDAAERSDVGTRPAAFDTDADGLGDGRERNDLGTDPLEPDSDGDGLQDGTELSLMLDPLNPDSDGDGFNDGWEVDQGTEPLDSASTPQQVSQFLESFESERVPPRWVRPNDVLAPWVLATGGSAGNRALQSSPLERKTLIAAVEWTESFTDATLEFDARRSNSSVGATYRFLLDGMPTEIQAQNWTRYEFDLPPGVHTLRWEFLKNDSDTFVGDRAMLDAVTVLPRDGDADGMRDSWERRFGLDPMNGADAAADPDQDNLDNLREFELGLDPSDADTDGDRMTDGWEVLNRLDPLSNDGQLDADGDGFTNREEFDVRSDPQDANSTPPAAPPPASPAPAPDTPAPARRSGGGSGGSIDAFGLLWVLLLFGLYLSQARQREKDASPRSTRGSPTEASA